MIRNCIMMKSVIPTLPTLMPLLGGKEMKENLSFLSKMAMDVLSIPITTVASESTFSAGGRVIDKKRALMRRDTIELFICAGDWIKEAYGIRSLKEGNEDPIELEFENEFEMKDANVSAPPQANIKGSCAITVTPSEVVQASRNVINPKNTNHPTTPRIAKKRSRKT